jgi:hypothetical protein
MATTHELNNRVPNTDGRKVWFPYQEKLMSILNSSWGERLKEEHQHILQNHPFAK